MSPPHRSRRQPSRGTAPGRPSRQVAARLEARRGAVLPLVCILLVVLIGAAALGIDTGRLHLTAAESQTVADAAALGGAREFQLATANPGSAATHGATTTAHLNRAAGAPGVVPAAEVLPARYRSATHALGPAPAGWTEADISANAVSVEARARAPYVLAGALGLAAPTVRRPASAWVGNMVGAACVWPVVLPYTAVYETVHGLGAGTYSNAGQRAPGLTQRQIAGTRAAAGSPPSHRTVVLVARPFIQAAVDSGLPVTGQWYGVNFFTRTPAGNPQMFMSSAAVATASTAHVGRCRSQATAVGRTVYPWDYGDPARWGVDQPPAHPTPTRFYRDFPATAPGECQRRPGEATCYAANGAAGVVARMALADPALGVPGDTALQVRALSLVRVMCWFHDRTEVCPSASVPDGAGGRVTWAPPLSTRYPPHTIIALIEGPVSAPTTPDVVLGDSLSWTQRLLLVR